MTIENDFLVWAGASGANVPTQAAYAALANLTTGVGSGTASSANANKVWRQASIIAAMIAQFIVDESGQTAIDDGTTATLETNFKAAVLAAAGGSALPWMTTLWTDTGSANALAVTLAPVPATLAALTGAVLKVKVAHNGTGAATLAPNGLAATAIVNPDGVAMTAGQLPASGVAALVYDGAAFQLLSVADIDAYAKLAGSASQVFNVANATTLTEAVALGQLPSTWADVTSSRMATIPTAIGSATVYTNSNTTPLYVSISGTAGGITNIAGVVNGVEVAVGSESGSGFTVGVCFIVPAGATYTAHTYSTALTTAYWKELS
jgi:hypothetical protein